MRTRDHDGLPLAPAWGWAEAGAGRLAHVSPAPEFQATSTQLCGLYPFTAGSGAPVAGTPIGRHMLWGEVVCLDPIAWLRKGLVTNPGIFILGEPGIGKSALAKRLITGAVATGTRVLIIGDTKPDYASLTRYFGGQVIRLGRSLDRLNPLDAGPLGLALARMSGPDAEALRWEVRSRRLALLMALCTLVHRDQLGVADEVILGRAVDILDARTRTDPTIPEVLRVISEGPEELRRAARAGSEQGYQSRVAELAFTLEALCTGTLAGAFDGPTSQPLNLDSPIISMDISAVRAAGDTLLTAAMLCTWSHAFAAVDAAAVLADLQLGPRRTYMGILDELWRALRGAPGLVEYADGLTRLNRARGMSSVFITHSLSDLEALPSPDDRAKAKGFVDRCAITITAGLPPRELALVTQVTPMTGPERELVAGWSAPESYQAGARHPGRGRYLVKTGQRLGLPVEMTLTAAERELYDTDQAIRPLQPGASRD